VADEQRFEAVYAGTYEQILGYAIRRCDSPEDAADVVAETYAIAWRKVRELPSGDEARLWLYGVARRVLANHRRGELRRRSRSVELREDVIRLYGRAPAPDERPDLRAIGRVFRELPDRDRELLSLFVWEGLDHAEIGRVLGCSRNAVYVRLHRARKRFSRALAAAGVRLPSDAEPFGAALVERRSL
jgi:RNA polymerase sigma-70 factor (ECF subfamily)